jgi:RimJ/RimL family protein N-acetyltransferase
MVDVDKIDLDRLRNPSPLFRLLEPTQKNLDAFAAELGKGYLFVSDEIRYPEYLREMVYDLYTRRRFNLIYEIGDFQGVIGFLNVIFDHKADMMLKMWDASFWGKDAVRQGKDLLKYVVETFGLKRVGTVTADPRIVKMAKLVGFTEEGARRKAFAWNKCLHDEILLSVVRD